MAEPALSKLTQEDAAVEVIWCAFELRPDPVPVLDPKGEYLQRVWRDSVYPLSEKLGFNMKLPLVQPRSRRAHEAAHWERAAGYFNEYNLAIFRAFFERGEDIEKKDVLVRLASDLGLDSQALGVALEQRDFEKSVLAEEQEAERYGIRAVPAFVAGGQMMLSGVQPLDRLKDLVAWAHSKTAKT
ncbi:MAG: DsbA family protein [Desulfobacterales bacterium]|uniref:DsbA family protein n=1 Tax=Candidatus Desulfatibia profunda TaxID=2841695 RepID=A0A8J6TLE2_9BACT|nr:DsbA family protein [Candidatus Desulfatibia profunda]MBL7179085.1 DsbA family protein [Desulfobacterales bacterium]